MSNEKKEIELNHNDKSTHLELQGDDQNSTSVNEITVKSISELTLQHLFSKISNKNNPLDQLFQSKKTRGDASPTFFNESQLDSNKNVVQPERSISSISSMTIANDIEIPHPLVQLPEQLDVRTKVHLKRIDSRTASMRNWCHRARKATYNFLNYPGEFWAFIYHFLITIVLLFYFGLVMFTTRTTWEENCFIYLSEYNLKSLFERLLFVHFVLEFLLRFWCSRAQLTYNKLTGIKWIFQYFSRPSHLFDALLLIGGSLSTICFVMHKLPVDFTQDFYALITLRGFHRLFNVIQWTSVKKRESPWRIIFEVFHNGGHLLFAMFYLVLLFIFVLAYVVYLAETHPDNHSINDTMISNLMDSLYATSITLLTIGFGDFSPTTYVGQTLMGVGIWLALALFSLPSGLIGTSVALKVSEQEECRKRKIRKILATILVQRAWRFVRRQRQFEMVLILYQMRKSGQETSLHVKTHKSLWNKIDHVVENRSHFFVSQFIQLLLLNRAKRKFREIVLLNSNLRPFIKSYWNKNRNILDILEQTQKQLKRVIHREREESQIQLLELDIFQLRLQEMEHKIKEQHEILREMVSENKSFNSDFQTTYL